MNFWNHPEHLEVILNPGLEALSVGADGSVASWYVKREDDEMVLGGKFGGPTQLRCATIRSSLDVKVAKGVLY